MPRMANESIIRQVAGFPTKGRGAELRQYLARVLGREWDGEDIASPDIQAIVADRGQRDDDLAARHSALEAQSKARTNLPDYDALIAERRADSRWNTMAQAARKLGLKSAFGMLYRYGVEIVEIEPDGIRVDQPAKALRYGIWQQELDSLIETLGKEKAAYQAEQDAEFVRALAQAKEARAEGLAYLAEQARLQDDELYQERLKTQAYNERLRDEKLAEERHQISVNSARAFLARAEHALNIARLQFASLSSPEVAGRIPRGSERTQASRRRWVHLGPARAGAYRGRGYGRSAALRNGAGRLAECPKGEREPYPDIPDERPQRRHNAGRR